MNPILITIGNFEIRWYSVLIISGFILGYFIFIKECKKQKIDTTLISDYFFYLIIFSIIGARIYYCIFNLDYYLIEPLSILKIWEGGLAIHGGIIAGIVYSFIFSKIKNINLLQILDILAPALAIGQAIGRWGNFFNSEAFGPIISITSLKRLYIPDFVIKGMYIDGNYHHPTFFYESIGCLLIFVILIFLRKKLKKGQVAGLYFILYGIIRFLIESLRQDSLMLGNIKVAQLVSILAIIIGLYLVIKPIIRSKYDKQKMGHCTKGRNKKRLF